MSQHGRHGTKTAKPVQAAGPAKSAPPVKPVKPVKPARRGKFGPVSTESVLVLGLIAVIAGGSVLVNSVQPVRQRTTTTYGETTYKTHTLGDGGVQPGEIQARTIVPVHIAATDQISGVTPTPLPLPKPKKTAVPTTAPTPAPTAGTVGGTPPILGGGGGGSTGNPGGSGSGCTMPLGVLCPKAPTAP